MKNKPRTTVKAWKQGGQTWALWWNGEKFEAGQVESGWRCDATAEIFDVYDAYLCGIHFRTAEKIQDDDLLHREQERRRVKQGRLVRVVNGRKVKKGTQGILFYMKETIYGINCGLRTSDRKDSRGRWQDVTWVDLKHLCVVDPRSNRLLFPLYL